jgi:hypothetical protein
MNTLHASEHLVLVEVSVQPVVVDICSLLLFLRCHLLLDHILALLAAEDKADSSADAGGQAHIHDHDCHDGAHSKSLLLAAISIRYFAFAESRAACCVTLTHIAGAARVGTFKIEAADRSTALNCFKL